MLVHTKHNRCLPDEEGEKLWEFTSKEAALGEICFTMPRCGAQQARPVRQQLWARPVEIGDGKRARISVTCIVAREIDAPEGVKPLEWRLLTNRQACTADQVVELIDWYRARWEIEIYFHILKKAVKWKPCNWVLLIGLSVHWPSSWLSLGASPS
jgi:hypothetical protein